MVIILRNLLFIGAGNMASAIAGGIIKSEILSPENIYLYDKNPDQYSKFDSRCKGVTELDNAFNCADIVFISVKPQNVKEILSILCNFDYSRKVFVSICAGVTIESIENILDGSMVIRTMPNTPLMLGQGVTAMCHNNLVSEDDFNFVKQIFSSSGYVTEIKECDINSLTAVTSSSPAYIYLFAKAIMEGAHRLGFDYPDTLKMICDTLIGSANMILSCDKSLDDLISMVKSPNGTTERALNVFESKNLIDIVCEAMAECKNRAEELSKLN